MTEKIPVLTFFNNKGGVGKTSLVYHLACMYADMGKRVLAVDLDPQSNLSAAFLREEQLESIWSSPIDGQTIWGCLKPLIDVGDVGAPILAEINANLSLIPGSVRLSEFEDELAEQWPNSMRDTNLYRPLRVLSSFWQVMQKGAQAMKADIILVDIGPNLGAINRSVLISTDFVVIPLAADLFSLQGLQNLGPKLRSWRSLWKKRLENWMASDEAKESQYKGFALPTAVMEPIGYIVQQHAVRSQKPVKAYQKWLDRMPAIYRQAVWDEQPAMLTSKDCLATIKHYRSLVPMSLEHRKPIFELTSADGAFGSHAEAARSAKADFKELAGIIAAKVGLEL
ncbi:MAG: ParA family protein [Gammaproteobacteria bacterium]